MQTSVVATRTVGIEGELADSNRIARLRSVVSSEVSAEMPFGKMVAIDSTSAEKVKLLVSVADVFGGIVVHDHSYAKDDQVGTVGLKPKTSFEVLREGVIWTSPEEDVDPTSEVHVRCFAGLAGELSGAFRTSITGNAITINSTTFTANAGTDEATAAAHGLLTGWGPIRVSNAGGGLPPGLLAATDYWVVRTGPNTFQFALTQANAIAPTPIIVDITGAGTGTQSYVGNSPLSLATMNLSKCARWVTSALAGKPAQLELDLRNVALSLLG